MTRSSKCRCGHGWASHNNRYNGGACSNCGCNFWSFPPDVLVVANQHGPNVWRCGGCDAVWMVAHTCGNPPDRQAVALAAAAA